MISEMLEKAGALITRFPVIEIQAVLNDTKLNRLFERVNQFQYLIFVSRNAVTVTHDNYLDDFTKLEDSSVIAIGQSTASALQQNGLDQVITADAGTDSEALLALPELAAASISEKNVLLVRGVGGRELLPDTLTERGADVTIAEVYMRNKPQYDTNEIIRLWQHTFPDAIIVTSNEAIENLLSLTPEARREDLLNTRLVVMSERNAVFARELGFHSPIYVSDEMNDTGLYNVTMELLETVYT